MKKRTSSSSLIILFMAILAGVIVFSLLFKPFAYCPGNCGNGVCDSCESQDSCPGDCIDINTARSLAASFVVNSINYKEFGGKNLNETSFTKIKDGFEFSYFFETTDPSISGFDVIVSVSDRTVASSNFTEIFRENFCGRSTMGFCSSDLDCVKGGCSSQVCQSSSDPVSITTCEYRDCYNAGKYNLNCKCISSQCQWI
jgi:eight-cysteine-cluster-containing protein